MPTKEEIEALKLGTGATITKDWYDKLVSALHEFRDEIDALYAPKKGIEYHTFFESLDGFLVDVTGSATITLYVSCVALDTGSTINSEANLVDSLAYPIAEATWNKKRRFKTKVYIFYVPDQEIWIIMGERTPPACVGFKVVGDKLYAITGDGTTTTELDTGITIAVGTKLTLEAILEPGVKASFYVNESLVGEITTTLPSGTSYADRILYIYIINTKAETRRIDLTEWIFIQEG